MTETARWEDDGGTVDTLEPDEVVSAELVPIETVEGEIVDPNSLTELAATANRFHLEALSAADSVVKAAIGAGTALLAAKEQCEHGTWILWLEANFHADRTTATRYMQIAKAANDARVHHLVDSATSLREALKAIAAINAEEREAQQNDAQPESDNQSDEIPTDTEDSTPADATPEDDSDDDEDDSFDSDASEAIERAMTTLWDRWHDVSDDEKAKLVSELRQLTDNIETALNPPKPTPPARRGRSTKSVARQQK